MSRGGQWEGCFHQQPTSENVLSSPSGVRDRAGTEIEFGYSTAVSIILVAIMLNN